MARKGYSNLSDAYRARLTRAGITQEKYESGASLQKARGHAPRAGSTRGSERYRALVRKAERMKWAAKNPRDKSQGSYTAEETIRAAIASGMSMAKINDLLDQRQANATFYHGPDDAGPGRFHYYSRFTAKGKVMDRKISALYWYHP